MLVSTYYLDTVIVITLLSDVILSVLSRHIINIWLRRLAVSHIGLNVSRCSCSISPFAFVISRSGQEVQHCRPVAMVTTLDPSMPTNGDRSPFR